MVQALLDSKNVTFLPAPEIPRTAFPAPPALGVAGGRTKAAVIGAEDGIARQEISAKVSGPRTPNLAEILVLSQASTFPIPFLNW